MRDLFINLFFLMSLFIPIAMCLVGMLALVTSLIVNQSATVHSETGRAPAVAQESRG